MQIARKSASPEDQTQDECKPKQWEQTAVDPQSRTTDKIMADVEIDGLHERLITVLASNKLR